MTASSDRIEESLKRARIALKQHPKNIELHSAIAPLYESEQRFEEALPHLAFLVSATSPDAELYFRYARALQRAGNFGLSLQVIEAGLKKFADNPKLLRSKALTFSLRGEYEKAEQVFYHLCTIDKSDHHSLGMAGMLKMLRTDMREGFEEYASRNQEKDVIALFSATAKWNGQSLAGKRILIWSEQGIGDVIMFISLMPWLLQQAGKVGFAVNPRLVPIIQRSLPDIANLVDSDAIKGNISNYDYHLPLGDLIKYALPYCTPSQHAAYFKADEGKTAKLRAQYLEYASQSGRKRLVGISWHTTNPEVGFTQNIPLADFGPLFSVAGVQFVSLQYGDHQADVDAINKQFKDILFTDPAVDAYNDIDGLAAQMCAMDEIISISNVTIHLAGALGVPVTFLTSAMPDWRWGLSGGGNRWYKSLRLERQEALLKWKPVIKRVRERLMAG
jgi:tetratricopeptide (TPR) repeat protein